MFTHINSVYEILADLTARPWRAPPTPPMTTSLWERNLHEAIAREPQTWKTEAIVPHRPPGLVGFFLQEATVSDLRAALVIDYQNVHLTGAGLFEPHQPPHEHLVHPLYYANRIVGCRNQRQRPGFPHAVVTKVLVYRGLPSADIDPRSYGRNLAQKADWELDPRVKVTHRPLRYQYHRDGDGRKATDQQGRWLTIGKPREKGIDVLVALAVIREARDPDVDLVILCSQDTDLEPSLDEALTLDSAKIETASWFDPKSPHSSHEIRPTGSTKIWNIRLGATDFAACRDRKVYL